VADHQRGEPPSGDWCGTTHLRFERHPPFAHLVVDRPRYKNTLTPAMYFGIRHAVEQVNRRPELAGLLLRADGETFITGGDLGNEVDDGWPGLGQLGMDLLPFDAVRRSDKPVVVAVKGLCQGGGLMLTLLADVAVASERATFRAPELLRGIADTYYAQILPRQVGPARARDLLLTGRRLGAAEALDWGLVARTTPHDALLEAATEALQACCYAAPAARAAVKRSLDAYYGAFDRAAMEESLTGPEREEGWAAFSERRAPAWIPEEIRPTGRL
jgi:enoyl-CoA hydratase/carnithine racemase